MTEITQADRDAAGALLNLLHIREHETGSFRSWDATVQAFAAHREAAEAHVRAEPVQLTGDRWVEWARGTKAIIEAAATKLALTCYELGRQNVLAEAAARALMDETPPPTQED